MAIKDSVFFIFWLLPHTHLIKNKLYNNSEVNLYKGFQNTEIKYAYGFVDG